MNCLLTKDVIWVSVNCLMVLWTSSDMGCLRLMISVYSCQSACSELNLSMFLPHDSSYCIYSPSLFRNCNSIFCLIFYYSVPKNICTFKSLLEGLRTIISNVFVSFISIIPKSKFSWSEILGFCSSATITVAK